MVEATSMSDGAAGKICETAMEEKDRPYKIALVGKTGAGKSSLGNLLIGNE